MFFHWNFRNCFKNCKMNSLAKLGVREWNYYFWKKNVLGLKTVMRYRVCVLSLFSRVWLFETLWTVARQAPLSMGFFRQEHWNGFLCPPPGDLLDPEIEPTSLTSPALAGGSLPWASSYYMSIGMVKIQNTDYTKRGCGAIETFIFDGHTK